MGYNWQFAPHWLVGIEGDVGTLGIDRTVKEYNDVIIVGSKADWYGTVRGRFGYVTGPSLLYVTGGVAFVHITRHVRRRLHHHPGDRSDDDQNRLDRRRRRRDETVAQLDDQDRVSVHRRRQLHVSEPIRSAWAWPPARAGSSPRPSITPITSSRPA